MEMCPEQHGLSSWRGQRGCESARSLARLEGGRSLDQSRQPLRPLASGTRGSLLQIRYKQPAILDVCAGQRGSVSQYYDIWSLVHVVLELDVRNDEGSGLAGALVAFSATPGAERAYARPDDG
ncbi:hypothetical protein GCM10023350_43360 [Nocardioides endophyticus]|uniref:Uncharacterized protein n=1 Tax=Nocardioides endophyticus TaxID=1353775 RepID=A0ABP8ZDE3_9ACTN